MKKLLTLIAALIITHVALAVCSPAFTYVSAPSGSYLLRTQFTNTTSFAATSSETVSYHIYYGDSGSDLIPATTSTYHVYTSPGTYTVILSMYVTDTSGSVICSAMDTQHVVVAYPHCGTLIHDSVVSTTATTEVVHFWPTTPSGDTITSYSWAFGDGGTSTLAAPNHTYSASGTFTVTLNVSSSGAGCSYSNSASIFISVVDCSADTAAMTVYPTTGYNVSYFVSHSAPLSTQYCTYAWVFGDGGTSSSLTGTHTYSSPGTYSPIITVNWVDSASGIVQCSTSHATSVTLTAVNRVSGYVLFSGPSYDTAGSYVKVWLIKYNSGTHLLEAVDSTVAVGGGAAYYYQFLGASSDTFRTKAYLHLASMDSVGYVPTYHDSSLYWNSAHTINHTSGGVTDNQNIYMKYGASTTGPGFIGGNVTTGANKATSMGIPAVGMVVYVFSSTGRLMQSTVTDSMGNFAFNNLPLGTYYVHPEAINYTTVNYVGISLTSSAPSMNAAYFTQHLLSMTITPVAQLGITSTIPNAEILSVFPNPAKSVLSVQWQSSVREQADFVIFDVTGRRVFQSALCMKPGTDVNQFDLSGLEEGLYIVTIKSEHISYNSKLQIAK